MVSSAARPRPSLKTLWQKIESSPLPETEESIILRILVQALVIVGIIATDVATDSYTSIGPFLSVLSAESGVGDAGESAISGQNFV